MKAKSGFSLRDICGTTILVAEGIENIDFNNIISMNETSAYLWRAVQDMQDFTPKDLAALLVKDYEVDEDTALADAKKLSKQWIKAGIVSE